MAMEPDAATPAARSLNVFPLVRDGVRLAVGDAPHDIGDYDYEAADGRAAAHLEASDQEAHGLLYGVGALRKQKILEGEGAPVEEGEEHEGEGEEGQGEDSGAPDQEDTEMA